MLQLQLQLNAKCIKIDRLEMLHTIAANAQIKQNVYPIMHITIF